MRTSPRRKSGSRRLLRVVIPLTLSIALGVAPAVAARPSAAATTSAAPAPRDGDFNPQAAYAAVNSQGQVFTFGGAGYWGDTSQLTLNAPIVGSAADPGGGYWLDASDGGIFAFGDAGFYGSMGGQHLNQPIVGIASTPDGGGYWEVASDGGIFAFGDGLSSGSAVMPLTPPAYPAYLSYATAPFVGIMTEPQGPQASHEGEPVVAFVGDSLGSEVGVYTAADNPPFSSRQASIPGCGVVGNAPIITPKGQDAQVVAACGSWVQQYQWAVAGFHPDAVVVQLGYWESQIRLYDGSYVSIATDPDYAAQVEQDLSDAASILHAGGAAVIFDTAPYYDDGTPDTVVDQFNQMLDDIAQNDSWVSIVDVNEILDPDGAFQDVVDGVPARLADGIHLTEDGVQQLIDPALIPVVGQEAQWVSSSDS